MELGYFEYSSVLSGQGEITQAENVGQGKNHFRPVVDGYRCLPLDQIALKGDLEWCSR